MAKLAPVLRQRFLDANGNPLSGGKVFSYLAGTTTPTATFTDQSGATPNANPVILDANGEANIWIGAGSYKFILTDSNDVQQWVVDSVMGTDDAPASEAASLAQAAQLAAEQAKTDAETAETNAAASALAASNSETAAGLSESNASGSEIAAAASALAASNSETAAGISEANASASEIAAGISEGNAAASESNAAASAAAAADAAAASLWNDVVFVTHTASPIAITEADRGKLYVVDTTGGAVTVNLPEIDGLNLSVPWSVGVKKSDPSANAITINAHASDEIRGGASVTLTNHKRAMSLIPDTDPTPDRWTVLDFGAVPTAAEVSFNNSGTGLLATTVQMGIAENKAYADAIDTDLVNHINASVAHGLTGSIVGTTDTQTLTNKTLTAPVVDVASLTEQSATPSTPSAGTKKLYAKNDGLVYTLDSSGAEVPVGSGSGGSGVENYLSSENSTFQTAAGDATVGDWTSSDTDKITITTTATDPLDGSHSGLITKLAVDAVNAYLPVASAVIPRGNRGKPIIIKMFSDFTHADYTSEDLEFQLWDITGTPAQIYVSGDVKIKKAKGEIILVGYPESDVEQVELRAVIATDSATSSSWTAKIDRVQLGPDKLVPSLFFRTEAFSLAGNFSAGSIRVSRVGTQVTIDQTADATCTSSATPTSGITLPTWARPTLTVVNVCSQDAASVSRVAVTSGGAFLFRKRNNAGTAISFTSFEHATISYTVPDTESPLISTTEALFKTFAFNTRGHDAQTIGTSGASTLIYKTGAAEFLDSYGSYNGTTGEWTSHYNGKLIVNASALYSHAADQIARLSVRTNRGSGIDWATTHSRTFNALTNGIVVSAVVDIKSGEKLTIRLSNSSTTDSISVTNNSASCSFSIAPIPDLSVYGVQGQVEILSAESNEVNPAGSFIWTTFTGNSITLTPGIWKLYGNFRALSESTSNYFKQAEAKFSLGNGDGAALSSSPSVTLLNGSDNNSLDNRTGDSYRSIAMSINVVVIRVTAPVTVFVNARMAYDTGTHSLRCKMTAERIA